MSAEKSAGERIAELIQELHAQMLKYCEDIHRVYWVRPHISVYASARERPANDHKETWEDFGRRLARIGAVIWCGGCPGVIDVVLEAYHKECNRLRIEPVVIGVRIGTSLDKDEGCSPYVTKREDSDLFGPRLEWMSIGGKDGALVLHGGKGSDLERSFEEQHAQAAPRGRRKPVINFGEMWMGADQTTRQQFRAGTVGKPTDQSYEVCAELQFIHYVVDDVAGVFQILGYPEMGEPVQLQLVEDVDSDEAA